MEQNLIKIRNNAAKITYWLFQRLTLEEVSKKLKVSIEEVKEIKEEINNFEKEFNHIK
jgi:hypothetical protein